MAPKITVTPAPIETVVLLDDADVSRLVSRPGVQRSTVTLV